MPDVLQPYIKEGTFDPGDFAWMVGRFATEGSTDRAAWDSIVRYNDACIAQATMKAKAELAALGAATEHLPPQSYGDPLCRAVNTAANLEIGSEVERGAFPARLVEARQLWNFAVAGGRIGISVVTSAVGPPEPADAQLFIAATFREQLGRRMLSWGVDERDPPLPANLKMPFEYLSWNMVASEDSASRTKLRAYMAEKGWPTITAVGEKASQAAWLLAQHADDDPALQVKALRLMEPLAKSGEANKSNYAYLYDRVMLKVAGKQRYATQFGACDAGNSVRPLRPMEANNSKQIDAVRAEMGLGPLADYRKQMDEAFGPCPSAK